MNLRFSFYRAWIRAALNDGLLTSYISTILDGDDKLKRKFYNKDAYWFDVEQTSLVSGLLQGIENLKFDLPYNVALLNSWGVTPLELSGYIKVATLPVLCKPDSLQKSGDISAAANQLTSSRTCSTFESSYFDYRYSTEALGDLDITTPRRRAKKKKHSISKRKSLATEISSLASCESLNISENFKLETSEDVTDLYSEGSVQNRPISTGSSTSDIRAQSITFDENEELENKGELETDANETVTRVEAMVLENQILAPTEKQSVLVVAKRASETEKTDSETHVGSESLLYHSVKLLESLDDTQIDGIKTSTPNISVLESSQAETGNSVLNYQSAFNTWTDTARSSPNLYPFLTLPDEAMSTQNKTSKRNSSDTSKTDISCNSNDNDLSSAEAAVG